MTIERLVAIKFPLQARFYWKPWKLGTVIVSIFCLSFVITFYHHLAYRMIPYVLCHGTQLVFAGMPTTGLPGASEGFKLYIEVSTWLSILFIIICPLIALTSLNIGLIFVLKIQHKFMYAANGGQSGDNKASNPNRARNSERKVKL